MYQRDKPKLPIGISRDEFVEHIFGIGYDYDNNYDTIIMAVELADRFMCFEGAIQSSNLGKKYKDEKLGRIMNTVIEKKYSIELAYVVLCIISKLNEDIYNSYPSEIENCYLYKMEWEICIIFDFKFVRNKFLDLLSQILWNDTQTHHLTLNSIFFDLSKEICLKQSVLNAHPITLFIGIFILYKHKKLKVMKIHKERILCTIFVKMAEEFDIP